jgi:hypothetical protein
MNQAPTDALFLEAEFLFRKRFHMRLRHVRIRRIAERPNIGFGGLEELDLSMSQRPLRKGDRVKLNLCSLTPEGTIVDEYSADYVSVQWDDLPAPATYSRRSLVLVDGESRAA